MNAWKLRLLTNWHLARIMRLGIGLMLLVMGVQSRDWVMGLFSGFFLFQAITDTGCCGSQGCYAPDKKMQPGVGGTSEETVEYEEVK